jgi:hypothetical protein
VRYTLSSYHGQFTLGYSVMSLYDAAGNPLARDVVFVAVPESPVANLSRNWSITFDPLGAAWFTAADADTYQPSVTFTASDGR